MQATADKGVEGILALSPIMETVDGRPLGGAASTPWKYELKI